MQGQGFKTCPACGQRLVLSMQVCGRCSLRLDKNRLLSTAGLFGSLLVLIAFIFTVVGLGVKGAQVSEIEIALIRAKFSRLEGTFCSVHDAYEGGISFHRYSSYEITPAGQVFLTFGDDKKATAIDWHGTESYAWDVEAVEANTAYLQTDAQGQHFTVIHPRNHENGVDSYRYYSLGFPADNYIYLYQFEPAHPSERGSKLIDNPGERSNTKHTRMDRRPIDYLDTIRLLEKVAR